MTEEHAEYRTGASGLFAMAARDVVVVGHELKPCPFCGSKDVHIETMSGSIILDPEDRYYVLCSDCRASGPDVSIELNAVTAWNKAIRAGES